MSLRSDQSASAVGSCARLYKAFVWLCTIVLVLQLSGAFFSHNHDVADDVADCVSCQLGSNKAAALPAAPPAILAIFLVVAYLVARRPEYVSITPRRYLIPQRQAPPGHFHG